MNRLRWLPVAALFGLAPLTPAKASAQVGQQQCVDYFLAACATLHFIDFSNTGPSGRGVLSLIVANTSDAALEANAYIRQLIFDFTGSLPAVQATATAQYGFWNAGGFTATQGDQEQWKATATAKAPKGAPPGFQLDFSVKDDAKAGDGGIKDRVAGVGEAVMITVDFDAPFASTVGLDCPDPSTCQAWSAEMKDLGADRKGKGFTATPEPTTLLLLATGFFGLAGVEVVRRRRRLSA
ncbi:MAG TPA: PEP-CTERM sorting domain-containing protein [Longimicrobiales bacterium]|nr:PEP-CTERM sorting domain-containing protein [Longimicrobiales bacterium]